MELATGLRAERGPAGTYASTMRLRRWSATLLACLAAVLLVASGVLFVWPATDEPEPADALVVLGPGLGGERLTRALELTGRELAPVVVVSRSRDPRRWPLERRLCATPGAICFRARPFTTRGEARIVADLARRHRWSSLLVVTSTYHATRVRLLYGRCFPGRLAVVAAEPRRGPVALVTTTLREWGGLLDALVRARGC